MRMTCCSRSARCRRSGRFRRWVMRRWRRAFFSCALFSLDVSIIPHMQFQAILTSIALMAGLMLPHAGLAKGKSRVPTADDAPILEMSQAFKKGDRKRLAALLPQAQGHLLEPWAAYW